MTIPTVTPETISLESLRLLIEQAKDLEDLARFFGWNKKENQLYQIHGDLCSLLRRRERAMLQRTPAQRVQDILSH